MKTKVEIVKIDAVKKNPSNPRLITEAAMQKLMKSIEEFPLMLEYRPILVDRKTGHIVGGNQRYEACVRLGMKDIPVAYIDGIDDKKLRELMLKDNIQFGEWDFTQLKEFYQQDSLVGWGLEDAEYVDFFATSDEAPTETKAEEPAQEEEYQEETYNENLIKKIQFNFPTEDYDDVFFRLKAFIEKHDLNDSSEALIKLIELYKKTA